MNKFILGIFGLVLTGFIINGCSSGNPTAPQVEEPTAIVSAQAAGLGAIIETEMKAVMVFPQYAQFTNMFFRANVWYDNNGRMTFIRLENMFGPITARFVIAQVQSLFTNYYAPSPVSLTDANGQWGTMSATLKIGVHADGNIIYVRQENSSYTNIFCYDIYSQTADSSRHTSYPIPSPSPTPVA